MYIGVDLGGSHIAAGLVDEKGKLIRKEVCTNSIDRSYKDYVLSMVELCKALIDKEGILLSDVKSVGVGFTGTPDKEKGTITSRSSIKVYDVPIRDEFNKHLDIKMYLENDANCAALGEAISGAARDADISVTITLGTGIGGGIIINKKIFSGFNNAASELGHHAIVVDGEKCPCGRKGCWEAYSSASALVREAKKLIESENDKNSLIIKNVNGDMSAINGKVIFEAAKMGDITAKKVVEEYTMYLAEGIANIINILMPEVLVIAGGISQQGDYLLNMLNSKVYDSVYTKNEPKTVLKIAQLGTDAGIIGAAMLGVNP